MPSRTSVTLGLALALLGSLTKLAWAEPESAAESVTLDKGASWVDVVEPYQGKVASFVVAEGWESLDGTDCVVLTTKSRWTFVVEDSNGSGAVDVTRLPGFLVRAEGASLTVTGGELSGWCTPDDDTTGALDVNTHLVSDDDGAVITLTRVGLGADTTSLSGAAPTVGLYGLAGTLTVKEQVVEGLPFPAAQLLGAYFDQDGGRYTGGATSALISAGSTVSLDGVTFVGGTAERGSGVDAEGGVLLVYSSTFEGGEAKTYGGAIAAQDTLVSLDNVKLLQNRAMEGGGVWVQGGSFALTDGELTGNVASVSGGAIFVDQPAEVKVTSSSFSGNSAPLGGGLSARSVGKAEITDTRLSGDVASLKGGALHLQQVIDAQLCGLILSGATAGQSGGGIYASDSTITLGSDEGSCAASQVLNTVAKEGAALSLIDTSAAPDAVGLSAVGLQLTQLNPDGEGEDLRITEDEAIYVATSGALTLRGLSTPGGLGDLALLTASEAVVTLEDVHVLDEAITTSAQFAVVQQSVIQLSRPASVNLLGARICGFTAERLTEETLAMVQIDSPVGDVHIAQSALFGAQLFGALVRVIPDDAGVSAAAVTLLHNSLIGATKELQDGATIFGESVIATGNLLHRLDVGLILSAQDDALETYNLFSDTVSTPRRDEGGQTVRLDETSTDEAAPMGFVAAFVEGSCAALPELLETSPAVNGGDPAGARDPDGSIADQGALPVTLDDTDSDGSYDIDDCAPDDPTIGDTLDEVYGDGIDNDCDAGTIDDDQDKDGLLRGLDCDDADPTPCPLVSEYFGGRAACGCAFTAPAPQLHWLAPLALVIWRRRRRQGS